MSEKIVINLDATSMGWTACDRHFELSNIQGYRKRAMKSIMAYGLAGHAFIKSIYKEENPKGAVEAAKLVWDLPKEPPKKNKEWTGDFQHLTVVCTNLWLDFMKKDNVKVLTLPDGQLAIEKNFRFLFYESALLEVWLCGTIDRLVKIQNGCFSVCDWKFTSYWKEDEFLDNFKMSRQLRTYLLFIYEMARLFPDTLFGEIGSTLVGARIDGIFLKSKANDTIFKSSNVFQFSKESIEKFKEMLFKWCVLMNASIQIQPTNLDKIGLINGTCYQRFGLCPFFDVCSASPQVEQVLLERDFVQRKYDPLNFNIDMEVE